MLKGTGNTVYHFLALSCGSKGWTWGLVCARQKSSTSERSPKPLLIFPLALSHQINSHLNFMFSFLIKQVSCSQSWSWTCYAAVDSSEEVILLPPSFFFSEAGSHTAAQAGFELRPQPPKCWDYKCGPPYTSFFHVCFNIHLVYSCKMCAFR